VCHAALCVLTGTFTIYYTVELRAEKYRIKKEYLQSRYDTRSKEDPASVFYEKIKAVEEHVEDKWKEEWLYYSQQVTTNRLVANVCICRKHRKYIDHVTMQILTGHGIFNMYRRTDLLKWRQVVSTRSRRSALFDLYIVENQRNRTNKLHESEV
jgi:hypothetical protein